MLLSEIHIEHFRGIENETISNIQSALILIGKNNSGKSAILAALRAFWGDYSPEAKDFYKNGTDFLIEVSFEIDDKYLSGLFYDSKIGFTKIPSSAGEYAAAKEGTIWADKSFPEFKSMRTERQQSELYRDISTREEYEPIWINSVKSKLYIQNGKTIITAHCKKEDCKVQYNIGEQPIKDIISFIPPIAFIDDTRNFSEEETGKARSLTSNIFNIILKNELFQEDTRLSLCKDCNISDCEGRCINAINKKSVDSLSIDELEKLINYKTKNSSQQITDSISNRFAQNYRPDFRVNIKATSSIDKSYSITTNVFDPVLNSEISLSNVGAGVRSIYVLSLLQSYQEMCNKNALFIIEEPELYLHPELQKSMAKTLWDISNNSQVVFTTHSPIMLNEFRSEDIRKVTMNLDQYKTIVTATTLDDVLNEIGYSSQDILNTDFVLFVEGKDDLECFKTLIPKYYDIDMNRFTVIDIKSCQHIQYYATLRFLDKTTMNQNFAIIRDADTMTPSSIKTKLENQLRENLSPEYLPTVISHLYITKYSSLEGFLIDFDLLLRHHVFSDINHLCENLKNNLKRQRERHIQYFSDKNSNETEKVSDFSSTYNEKTEDPQANLDWIKTNFRGHDLFGYVNGGRIPIATYASELPESAFKDLIDFLNTIEYFRVRKKV